MHACRGLRSCSPRTSKRGLRVSLGQLIRTSLEAGLREPTPVRDEDPLFADDAVFEGRAPRDLARNHDRHLYGDPT